MAIRLSTSILTVVGLTFTGLLFGQQLDVTSCANVLGNGYDQLSESEKSPRLTSYGGCVHRRARSQLNTAYQDVRREVDAWHNAANRSLREQILALSSSERDVLAVNQQVEQDQLTRDFDARQATIDEQTTPENRREMRQQRADLSAERREARTNLNGSHRTQTEEINDRASDSITIGEDAIDELVAEDREDLAAQYETRSDYLDERYQALMDTPIDQSINDYREEQGPSANNPEVRRCGTYGGCFQFITGLIGREDPDDVSVDTPMGSIGIRG